jgi:hypothetical protein
LPDSNRGRRARPDLISGEMPGVNAANLDALGRCGYGRRSILLELASSRTFMYSTALAAFSPAADFRDRTRASRDVEISRNSPRYFPGEKKRVLF